LNCDATQLELSDVSRRPAMSFTRSLRTCHFRCMWPPNQEESMTRHAVLVGLIAMAFSAGCPASSDSRCNLENCGKLLLQCKRAFAADPNFDVCFKASDGGVPPSFWDAGTNFSYCPAACNATQGGGALVQCYADHQAQCSGFDDGGRAAVDLMCEGVAADAGTADATCAQKCDATRISCDQACASTDFDKCMNCSATCGLSWASCTNACPRQ
jgi:hypothetical protein